MHDSSEAKLAEGSVTAPLAHSSGTKTLGQSGPLPSLMQSFLPRISIIAPAYNESANIRPLVAAIAETMGDIRWELIIVDDDSPDGTAVVAQHAAMDGYPVRCIRRVGRRGLASAVVEGVLASQANCVAVIDADMQHDERLLPKMLELIESDTADVVVGTRYTEGGGLSDWSATRARMSAFATWCSNTILGRSVSDPMSGFFAIKRDVFNSAIYDLSQQGYKILLDVLTSTPRETRVAELPYEFRSRTAGESKIDVMVLAEFLFLLIEKVTKGLIPPRFVLFAMVGFLGLGFHLLVLEFAIGHGLGFLRSQLTATVAAMTLNYLINNSFTYRHQRLSGLGLVTGYIKFGAVCSLGNLANISVANLVIHGYDSAPLAGIAGALMSSVFNFGAASQFVWRQKRHRPKPALSKVA